MAAPPPLSVSPSSASSSLVSSLVDQAHQLYRQRQLEKAERQPIQLDYAQQHAQKSEKDDRKREKKHKSGSKVRPQSASTYSLFSTAPHTPSDSPIGLNIKTKSSPTRTPISLSSSPPRGDSRPSTAHALLRHSSSALTLQRLKQQHQQQINIQQSNASSISNLWNSTKSRHEKMMSLESELLMAREMLYQHAGELREHSFLVGVENMFRERIERIEHVAAWEREQRDREREEERRQWHKQMDERDRQENDRLDDREQELQKQIEHYKSRISSMQSTHAQALSAVENELHALQARYDHDMHAQTVSAQREAQATLDRQLKLSKEAMMRELKAQQDAWVQQQKHEQEEEIKHLITKFEHELHLQESKFNDLNTQHNDLFNLYSLAQQSVTRLELTNQQLELRQQLLESEIANYQEYGVGGRNKAYDYSPDTIQLLSTPTAPFPPLSSLSVNSASSPPDGAHDAHATTATHTKQIRQQQQELDRTKRELEALRKEQHDAQKSVDRVRELESEVVRMTKEVAEIHSYKKKMEELEYELNKMKEERNELASLIS